VKSGNSENKDASDSENVDPAGAPKSLAVDQSHGLQDRWLRWFVVLALLFVGVAAVYFSIGPRVRELTRQSQLQQAKITPLTALPGQVWAPSFSPDGSQIAFAWHNEGPINVNGQLYAKVIGKDKLLRLTDLGDIGSVAWSPDGKTIAFWRFSQEGSGIFLTSPLGGPEHRILSGHCPCLAGGSLLSWSPDGKYLAFPFHPEDSPKGTGAQLFVLSLDTLETAPVQMGCKNVVRVSYSPHGDYLAWVCAENENNVTLSLQRLTDLGVIRLLDHLGGVVALVWSADGKRIVFSSTGVMGSNLGGSLMEVAVDRPDHADKLPFGKDAAELSVTYASRQLAFEEVHANHNIWRADLSNPQAPAQKIVSSSRVETAPDYSPDRKKIAFQSTRSGSNETWVSDADGSNPVQLSSFGIVHTGSPHWSPDGKLIVFDSSAGGQANLYVVDPQRGVPRKLDIDVPGNSNPSWSRDGNWIYFVNGSDVLNPTIWKVPSNGGHAVQLVSHAALFPLDSPDGQYLYFLSLPDWHLRRIKTDGSEEQLVEDIQLTYGEAWRPFGSGIYTLGHANNKWEIDFFDLDMKKSSTVFVMDKFPAQGWMGGLPVSPDGRYLLFAQTDGVSSDLMLVDNWQ
jgi:Tol biopolymer transport system component